MPTPTDSWSLYALMLKSRLFEEATARLWHDGLISGELHLGTGEEAITAGVIDHLQSGDALALDHRGTAALIMRGVDPYLILREMLGMPDGLCRGMGGHMHLFSKEHLAASSGIIGASGPTAAGFALAAQYLRPGTIAVSFFGEGAMNQGMLMESLNLASVWKLPIVFVCKDDGWSITEISESVTGGDLNERARGLGVPTVRVDGRNVAEVWTAALAGVARARSGDGPSFIRARCVHLEAHFLGFQLQRLAHNPLAELPPVALPLARSFLSWNAADLRERVAGVRQVVAAALATYHDPREDRTNDPIRIARRSLAVDPSRLQILEDQIEEEIGAVVAAALRGVSS